MNKRIWIVWIVLIVGSMRFATGTGEPQVHSGRQIPTWLRDEIMLSAMFSTRNPPPRLSNMTATEVAGAKALWRGLSNRERRILIDGMKRSYLAGPFNISEMNDTQLAHLLSRNLNSSERKDLKRTLASEGATGRAILKRLLMNCLVRTL